MSETRFIRAVTAEDLPFVRAILQAPEDYSLKLVYADWLAERGDFARSEFLRMWVAINDPANEIKDSVDFKRRFLELHEQMHPQWIGFVQGLRSLAADGAGVPAIRMRTPKTDAMLRFGPCAICGRSENISGCVSRMPCEICGQVFCWECADTGVYGSLPDFEHFVRGQFSKRSYHLGSDSCLFCQETTWMKAHGG